MGWLPEMQKRIGASGHAAVDVVQQSKGFKHRGWQRFYRVDRVKLDVRVVRIVDAEEREVPVVGGAVKLENRGFLQGLGDVATAPL